MDASKLGVGSIITDEQHREAIHCAIAPVVAGEDLLPGEHVGFNGKAEATPHATKIGIVDPFLKVEAVRKGQTFWLFLYPGSITSLRHEWTHPAFEREEISAADAATARKVAARLTARDRIEAFLQRFREEGYDEDYERVPNFNELIEGAKRFLQTGDDICLNFDTPSFLWDEGTLDAFWRAFEDYTGIPGPGEDGNKHFFRCAC